MTETKQSLGIIGFGAFGQLMARHLAPHFSLCAFDPAPEAKASAAAMEVPFVSVRKAASCDVVVLAAPVPRFQEVLENVAPHLKKGALVLDVCSVKVKPARMMTDVLPAHADIVCTHPLFGPQSAKNGIAGLKIVVCPLRGARQEGVAAFLSSLGLEVIVATPEEHDREVAMVQGLTHLIAKVLVEMEPLPKRLTTRSFELMMEGVDMVRHDSMELFLAIERDNPFAADLRRKFFSKADALRFFLESRDEDATT